MSESVGTPKSPEPTSGGERLTGVTKQRPGNKVQEKPPECNRSLDSSQAWGVGAGHQKERLPQLQGGHNAES